MKKIGFLCGSQHSFLEFRHFFFFKQDLRKTKKERIVFIVCSSHLQSNQLPRMFIVAISDVEFQARGYTEQAQIKKLYLLKASKIHIINKIVSLIQ